MSDWGCEHFVEFFEALWGHAPFAWQAELASQVLAAPAGQSPWPQAIALPTASGKTACMDVAVYALAAHAGRAATGGLRMPRRIFFVVDRRVIVDEAHDRAQRLAKALAEAEGGILKTVADRLRHVGGHDIGQAEAQGLPLAVQALRGGQPRSDDWAATPLQPTIVAATVDQVGSRLLFRAYGPQPGMWPVHAALVGNDALILLDEAHCAQPMLQTLRAVQRYRGWAEQPLPLPFEVAVLSATPPADVDAARVFHDTSGEGRDPAHPLGRRQMALKPARLVVATKAKGRGAAPRRTATAAELVAQAFALVADWVPGEVGAPAVVVFCNRVDTARQVHALLTQNAKKAHLLTGRMRPVDKDDVVEGALSPLRTSAAAARRLDQVTFVVATQTLEVGADLDFDLLVSECASLDALRQRFGRLNRSGRGIAAQAAIVASAYDVEGAAADAVYGEALQRTWSWLQGQASTDTVATVDFGVSALAAVLPAGDELAALNAPSARAPVMLPAHLDLLAQTAPQPQPSPEPGLYLHGPNSGAADVLVCWRADLASGQPGDGGGTLAQCVDALLRCPPSSPECLAVPYAQARRWLDNQAAPAGADLENLPNDDDVLRAGDEPLVPRRALRWRGREHSEWLDGGARLRPGDLLVIPAQTGGFDELGTLGPEPVADWGDRAGAAMRHETVLRLHQDVLAQWPARARLALDDLASNAEAQAQWKEDPTAFAQTLCAALSAWSDALADDPSFAWLRSLVERATSIRRLDRALLQHPCGGWIICLPRLPAAVSHGAQSAAAFFGDEDDAASSGHFRSLLIDAQRDGHSHLSGVGALAAHYAARCGLPAPLIQALQQAGDGHDLGKADPRFQSWLRNGVPWVTGPLLAKSDELPQGWRENSQARLRAGYPAGGRHELLSVRLLESCAQALPDQAELRELLLHLVESHHGHCRPMAPVVVDAEPVEVSLLIGNQHLRASSNTGLERLDAGPAERYWRLTRRYGWWGLAWLESLLRLADHRRSEWEQRQRRKEAA